LANKNYVILHLLFVCQEIVQSIILTTFYGDSSNIDLLVQVASL